MPNKFQEEVVGAKQEPKPQPQQEPDYNPLDEAVNEKKYTNPNVNPAGIDFTQPINEPVFTPPPFQKKAPPVTNEKPPKIEPLNPELKNVPKKEQELSAKQAAKLIIQGYEWMHDIANKGLLVSEKKLSKLQSEGEINLNAMIEYDYGKKIRAGEFFQDYNRQISGILKVSDEFKDETIPVLERVLAKRGIGMTDENYLMYLFGKDIAAKSIIFFQQKQQIRYMVEVIKQATLAQGNAPSPQAPPPPPPPQPETEFAPKERERPLETKFNYTEDIIDARKDDYLKKAKEEKNDDYIKKAKTNTNPPKQKQPLIERPKRPRGRPRL